MGDNEEIRDGMSCKELVELVTEYLDKVLSASDRARFDAHMQTCPGCTDYLEQMRLTLRVSGRLEEDSIEPEARNALLNTFRNWKNRSS